jgi:signal transduction histidine kinase
MKTYLERWSFHAAPVRAWLENLAVGLLLVLGVLLVASYVSDASQQNGMFIAVLSAVTLYALRMRLPHGVWWRQIVFEGIAGSAAVAAMVVILFVWAQFLIDNVTLTPSQPGLMAIVFTVLGLDTSIYNNELPHYDPQTLGFVILLCSGIAYYFTRTASRVWLFWSRLRRRHLIWSITHTHLMLVALAAFIGASFMTFNYIHYVTADEPEGSALSITALFDLVPVFIVLGVLTIILLFVVLPPAAVLSYFAARRTTRRLKSLTQAANALSQGEYGVLVPVQGEDEVALLQTNFNAMSADLERAMHDLQAERDAVTTLLRSRRELIASVSHELRTPVAILRGHLESILERWPAAPSGDMQRDLGVMEQETVRLQRLIEDLFTLSRAEVGRLDLQRKPADLAPVIRRCVDAAAPLFWKANKVEVIADLPNAMPPVLVDEERLEQILHNLLRNGVRHTPPGGIVAVTAQAEAEAVIVQVKDTGEGIAPDVLPRIWERFYRSDSARAQERDGAGLGLALVKEMTEAMGGSVAAESTPGQGSSFTLRLPRAAGAYPKQGAAS